MAARDRRGRIVISKEVRETRKRGGRRLFDERARETNVYRGSRVEQERNGRKRKRKGNVFLVVSFRSSCSLVGVYAVRAATNNDGVDKRRVNESFDSLKGGGGCVARV